VLAGAEGIKLPWSFQIPPREQEIHVSHVMAYMHKDALARAKGDLWQSVSTSTERGMSAKRSKFLLFKEIKFVLLFQEAYQIRFFFRSSSKKKYIDISISLCTSMSTCRSYFFLDCHFFRSSRFVCEGSQSVVRHLMQ